MLSARNKLLGNLDLFSQPNVLGAKCPDCISFKKCSLFRIFYHEVLIGVSIFPQSCSFTFQLLICE